MSRNAEVKEVFESILKKYNYPSKVCVYQHDETGVALKIEAPSDLLTTIDALRIQDPVLLDNTKIWVSVRDNLRDRNSYRFMKLLGNDTQVDAILTYLKMVM